MSAVPRGSRAAQAPAVDWQWSPFADLTAADVYAMLALRQDVFVVEQECVFPDIDWIDQQGHHLLGWQTTEVPEVQAAVGAVGANGARQRILVACLRCLPPGAKFLECSIGRVVTAAGVRGSGIGRRLVAEGVRRCEAAYPGQPIRIGAQLYLEDFYRSFGFETVSSPYDEDDIMHIEMLRPGQGGQLR